MSDYLIISALEMLTGIVLVLCPLLALKRITDWLGKPGVIRAIFFVAGAISGIGGIWSCWDRLQRDGVVILFSGQIAMILMGLFLMVCPKEMLEDYARRWGEGSRNWSKGYLGPFVAMVIGVFLIVVSVFTYSNGSASFH